ncbi:MAG: efflux RND transporter periplasmic adaptor subunit [candidate division WOR-3 bacterium]|nr:efflux RND transporter periplasmic adaptor subunit [candidate division WOR-3 bacterium]
MKKKARLIIIIGIVAILILIVILNLSFKDQGIKVETTVVDYGSIISKVSGDGQLKAKAQINIQSQIMGTVEKLYVKEGDIVQKGQLICLLEQTSAKADLISAQAQFEQSQQVFIRSESLYAVGLIATQEYEQFKAQYQIAQARLAQAQDRFNKTMITAPISGTVTQLNIEEGETVIVGTMNNLGTVMMVIADLTKMLGVITIDETEVPFVKPNAKSLIRISAFPDTTFDGVVRKIGYMPKQTVASNISEQSTDFEVEIELAQTSPHLRPGMSINAEIITNAKDSVLVVPIQAVGRRKIKDEEIQTVFVPDKGVAKLIPVKTGINNESQIEIIDGLKPGMQVITGPYKVLAKLKDGDRVTIDRRS